MLITRQCVKGSLSDRQVIKRSAINAVLAAVLTALVLGVWECFGTVPTSGITVPLSWWWHTLGVALIAFHVSVICFVLSESCRQDSPLPILVGLWCIYAVLANVLFAVVCWNVTGRGCHATIDPEGVLLFILLPWVLSGVSFAGTFSIGLFKSRRFVNVWDRLKAWYRR